MGDLIHVFGETDGSTNSGTFTLVSDMFHSGVDYFRIPKGLKAKVWCKRISGQPVDVSLEVTGDATATPATWVAVSVESLASAGELILEKRRPIVIIGRTGKEAFRLSWSQDTAAKSYVEVEVELTGE